MKHIYTIVLTLCFINYTYGARPFATDDAGTVSKTGYELEICYDFGKDDGVAGISFKHGLTQRMDIGVEFEYNTISEPKNCFSPLSLCLKYSIIPDFFSASISNESGTSAYDINTIFTKVFGIVEVDANFGYSVPGDFNKGSLFYALAIIAGFWKFDFGVEIFWNENEFQKWLFGGRFSLIDGFNIDTGISSGFNDKNEIKGTFGLHYEF